MELLDDAELRSEADSLRERARNGEALDDLLPEAFALAREAARRTIGQRHFDVQLIGGMVLHSGSIAEMKTGEGKTLTATLPVFLNTLAGDAVHLVTVNDYLARRDAEWMRPIYDALGVTVSAIQEGDDPPERREKYACDVTYGTNSEFGFDYLRDNMAGSLEECVQRGYDFAIVDEVDNILIDEARTPLIISGPPRAGRRPLLHVRPPRQADEGRAPQGEAQVPGRVEGHAGRRLRLRVRREAQDRRPHRGWDHEGRGVPRRREPLPRRARDPRQPPDPVPQGRVALQARRRVRGGRGRGDDHRRVHRPHPRGPALVRGPAPGDRGEGGRLDQGGEPDPRHDHAPELLPALREALGNDGHGADRGPGVHEDLQGPDGRDPDQRRDDPRRPERRDLQDQGRQVEGRRRGDRAAPRDRPAHPGRDDLRRDLGDARRPAQAPGDRPRRPQRQARVRRAGGRDDRPGGAQGRGHHRHEHGGARRGHQARRQPRGHGSGRASQARSHARG